MQIEGSVMGYSEFDDGLGKNRILGSRSYLDCVLTMLAGSQSGAHKVRDPNIFSSRVPDERAYLSLGLFKSRGIITPECLCNSTLLR